MLRLYLILFGILLAVLSGIFLLQPDAGSPFQVMEWEPVLLEGAVDADIVQPKGPDPSFISAGLPPAAEPEPLSEKIIYQVPFTVQAPFGEWEDPRYQDGCEEASALMAIKAVKGEDLSREQARDLIADMSAYQSEKYGSFIDTSASSTLERLIEGYFGYVGRVEYGIDKNDIIDALRDKHLVLAPTNGRLLANPGYTRPGPERHMIVIRGYDPETDRFITNDPGTRRGEGYEYEAGTLMAALADYPTGDHLPLSANMPNAIILIPIQ